MHQVLRGNRERNPRASFVFQMGCILPIKLLTLWQQCLGWDDGSPLFETLFWLCWGERTFIQAQHLVEAWVCRWMCGLHEVWALTGSVHRGRLHIQHPPWVPRLEKVKGREVSAPGWGWQRAGNEGVDLQSGDTDSQKFPGCGSVDTQGSLRPVSACHCNTQYPLKFQLPSLFQTHTHHRLQMSL